MTHTPLAILATLPDEGGYIHPVKLVFFLLCVLLFAHNAAWVQKDIRRIRMPPGLWSPLVFGAGIVGLFAWLLLPIFWLGLLLFAAIYGCSIVLYLVNRNQRVPPTDTVLTLAHLQRLGKSGGASSDALVGKDRVRIKDASGKTPAWPNEPEQHAGYQALQDLLFDAIWRRASDVRIDLAVGQDAAVFYRVDGVDRSREPIAADLAPLVFVHMKRIAGLNVEERRKPQTGKFRATIGAGGKGDKSVDIEAKSSGSSTLERLQLRVVSEESKYLLSDIGLTEDQFTKFQSLKSAKGVVLVTSPKSNGLTTTLYAMLRAHDAYLQNIHTLEIAKALDLENITQHLFDSQGGTVTFGKRLRSILRTEPDVCMAGDMPDPETASLIAAAGKQSKRVYLGFAAKDVFSALAAYIQAVGDPTLAAAGLLVVTNQRLLRLLCTNCRVGYRPDPGLLKKGNLPTGEDRPFYRPPNPDEVEVDKKGNPIICPICQGAGYLGRTAVFEILFADDNIRSQVASGAPVTAVRSEARKRGMLLLQEVALRKVYEGRTSIAEVLRVTKSDTKPAERAASPSQAGQM